MGSVSSAAMSEPEAIFDEQRDPREEGILDRVFELLNGGPLSETELINGLGPDSEIWALAEDQGVDAIDLLDDLIWRYEGFWTLTDDRIASVEWILDGLFMTHRLTAAELDAGALEDGIDISALEIDPRGMALADGSGMVSSQPRPTESDGYVLVGPDGWLDGFQAGDLIALRREGDVLWVERVPEPGSGEALSDTLRELTMDRRSGSGIGTDLFPVVFDTIAKHRDLFRVPRPPLTDLIRDAGLSVQGEHVGPADEDWEPEYTVAERDLRDRLGRTWNLDICCEGELDQVIEGWRQFLFDSSPPDRRVAEALTHGAVANAFLDRETSRSRLGDTLLRQHTEFASALVKVAGAKAAGAFLLRALMHDFEGRVLEAEADFERALTMDSGCAPALLTLAEYASERGEARRSLSLMRRAGIPADHPTVLGLTNLVGDYSGVGRNDPCPCGSGRKYKVCCQQHPRIPPDAATKFLTDRISGYVGRHHQSEIVGLASSAVADSEFEVDDLIQMTRDPFILQLAVFEGRLIEDYLEVRGPLLTSEDRQLVTDWFESSVLRLWEVTGVESDHISLRRVGNDEIAEVPRPTELDLQAGEYLLARVGSSYDRDRMIGEVLTVHERYLDRLLWLTEHWLDPDFFAHWYGNVRFPPTETNREGHALVRRVAWLAPPRDLEETESVLDGHFARTDGGWSSIAEIDGEPEVRAVLAWEDDVLRVETDSEERLASVLVTLADWTVTDQEWPDREMLELDDEPGIF